MGGNARTYNNSFFRLFGTGGFFTKCAHCNDVEHITIDSEGLKWLKRLEEHITIDSDDELKRLEERCKNVTPLK